MAFAQATGMELECCNVESTDHTDSEYVWEISQ